MKFTKYILTLLFTVGVINAYCGIIVLEGQYQNENIYVQNAIAGTGVGFCTYEVTINGNVATDEINASAFEIDLKQYNLAIGTPVSVKIKYKDDGCLPKVLNPNALKPKPTFDTRNINISSKGVITWSTENETVSLPFIVEQFKWNKWVQVGEIQGKGGRELHEYSFRTSPIAGKNKFRIKQKGYKGSSKFSPAISYISMVPEVKYIYKKRDKMIEFSRETSYEVYDKFGNIVKKGYGKEINVSNLEKDIYFMNYGNTMTEFKKK